MLTRCSFLVIAAHMMLTHSAAAGDWPQILGPGRDGIAVGETLLDAWPASGPEEIWTSTVGQGFAGVAVRNNVVFLFHRVADEEIVSARDAATGKELWSSGFPCRYQSGISSDSGPRCVPVVTDDRVFVFGVEGQLRCLDAATGKEIWRRDTREDFGAPEGYFGAGSTPVLFADRLIVNVGGRENSSVVAFSSADGSTLWKSFSDAASYSSPVVVDVNGATHAIVVTRLNVVSLNPDDGAVRFSFPFGARGPTVNAATPIVSGDQLFVTASYRVGSVRARISESSAETTSSGETLLATQYATPIAFGNLLFAVDGRQDAGTGTLKCIDPQAGRVLWSGPDVDYGSLIRVNEELLLLTCGGELIRFAADGKAFREVHRSQVLNPTPEGYRLPAISNGRLFVRDGRRLRCLQAGKSPNITP